MTERVATARLVMAKETAVVCVEGELDARSADDIQAQLLAACGEGCLALIADLRSVRSLEREGLGMLLEVQRQLHERGQRFLVVVSESTAPAAVVREAEVLSVHHRVGDALTAAAS